MADISIGIIGGTGLYEMEAFTGAREFQISTPFGTPSDKYIVGNLGGTQVAFLSRHGRGHRLLPSELNFRANIYGFKKLGVEHLISVSAVGSLREHIHPTDVVVPDQLVDRTRGRVSTFFGEGLVAHIAFAHPFCPVLSGLIADSVAAQGGRVHKNGTLVCIEGPAFSTYAESNLYRQWGMDIIGMTTLQEAKLAREAEICYAVMSMVTDYDCWHPEADSVSVETVIQYLEKNAALSKTVLRHVIPRIKPTRNCACAQALKGAIVTAEGHYPMDIKRKMGVIVDKYLDPQ